MARESRHADRWNSFHGRTQSVRPCGIAQCPRFAAPGCGDRRDWERIRTIRASGVKAAICRANCPARSESNESAGVTSSTRETKGSAGNSSFRMRWGALLATAHPPGRYRRLGGGDAFFLILPPKVREIEIRLASKQPANQI